MQIDKHCQRHNGPRVLKNTFLYFINEQRNKGKLVTLPKDSLLSCTASPTDAQTGGIFPL